MGPRPRDYDYPLPMKGKSIFVLIKRSSIARLAHGAGHEPALPRRGHADAHWLGGAEPGRL